MLRNTYLYKNRIFTNKVILEGKEKELGLIKRVKLTREFEDAHEVTHLLKVGLSGLEGFS